MCDTAIKLSANTATKVRKYRLAKNVSQLDLECRASLPHGCISRIEKGKTNPTKETLISISIALGLNLKEITDLFSLAEVLFVVNNVAEDYQ